MSTRLGVIGLLCAGSILPGCYSSTPSNGGGQGAAGPRRCVSPHDVAVPCGYDVEVVATGLTYPSGIAFDGRGVAYVTEAGFAYGIEPTTPRLVRIEPNGAITPIAVGDPSTAPWNGVDWRGGSFFLSEAGHEGTGQIVRLDASGASTVLASGLPSGGDHHTNGPVVSADGWVYFGQGTVTNSAVVGQDSADFGWLGKRPQLHDIPARDVVLAGQDFMSGDARHPGSTEVVATGAFVPFGTRTTPGQVIPGAVPCSGSILRVRSDALASPELVAWGLRNPFGLAFAPDGALFVTDNGYDERGSRPIFGAGDLLWRIQPGLWYGWPDYSGEEPLFDPAYAGPRCDCPRKVLAEDPNPPQRPAAILEVHSASTGFDFSRNPAFGHVGEAFIAQFGDMAGGVGRVMHPVGFKVIRVDVANGISEDFAVNYGADNGPATKVGTCGLERPVAVRFDPSGRWLYVVDFGTLTTTGGKPTPHPGTGVVWRIGRRPA
jgi:glucose/arabinose dehydrogenase